MLQNARKAEGERKQESRQTSVTVKSKQTKRSETGGTRDAVEMHEFKEHPIANAHNRQAAEPSGANNWRRDRGEASSPLEDRTAHRTSQNAEYPFGSIKSSSHERFAAASSRADAVEGRRRAKDERLDEAWRSVDDGGQRAESVGRGWSTYSTSGPQEERHILGSLPRQLDGKTDWDNKKMVQGEWETTKDSYWSKEEVQGEDRLGDFDTARDREREKETKDWKEKDSLDFQMVSRDRRPQQGAHKPSSDERLSHTRAQGHVQVQDASQNRQLPLGVDGAAQTRSTLTSEQSEELVKVATDALRKKLAAEHEEELRAQRQRYEVSRAALHV
jgi:hypothetical protein